MLQSSRLSDGRQGEAVRHCGFGNHTENPLAESITVESLHSYSGAGWCFSHGVSVKVPDKYSTFFALAAAESAGAYSITAKDTGSSIVIAAPHGGAIEPGTTEIALAIAAEDLSCYLFEGAKPQCNGDLHITSSNFDEPQCLTLLKSAEVVVTVHGERSDDEVVYVGGLHRAAFTSVSAALSKRGFVVLEHLNPALQGRHQRNICNIGRSGAGVQLELSKGLRRSLFSSLTQVGRRTSQPRLQDFCEGVRDGLGSVGSDPH